MSHRISKFAALTGVSAVLALGGAGIAQASPDHGSQSRDHSCKTAQGKHKHECKHHEQRHGTHDKSRR